MKELLRMSEKEMEERFVNFFVEAIDNRIKRKQMAYHVVPVDDKKEHEDESTCACKPTLEMVDGEMVFIHNSYDWRELDEMANKLRDDYMAEWRKNNPDYPENDYGSGINDGIYLLLNFLRSDKNQK